MGTQGTGSAATVKIRGLELGTGAPAIIVPVVGGEVADLSREARSAVDAGADMIEWRCDPWLVAHGPADNDLTSVASTIRDEAGETPVLATVRTAAEGGTVDIGGDDLLEVYRALLETSACDLLDVQMLSDAGVAQAAVRESHAAGVPVVGSHHRFDTTPDEDDLVSILGRLAEAGADVPKLAVMPRCEEDVLALLRATLRAHRELGIPLITMSMGTLGAISRLAGQLIGSAATFATVEETSAPGQMPVQTVRESLAALRG